MRYKKQPMRFFSEPINDLMAAMDAQVVRASHPRRALVIVLVAGVASWWAYVPVHELLHALGCYVTGGSVTELQIAPEYGGALFARFLPFVVGTSDYAGRLSGFDTKGSDLVYLATDALPFALSLFIGVPLLKACARGGRPVLLGTAFVLALAPFYCLTGDYYEMGSIITTRALTWLNGGATVRFAALRSDDVVKLLGDVWTRPAEFQVRGSRGALVAGVVVVGGLTSGALLAFATYAAGARLAGASNRKRALSLSQDPPDDRQQSTDNR
jgi:hypothetical protein